MMPLALFGLCALLPFSTAQSTVVPTPYWLQWHGKAATSCPDLDAFLACGNGLSTETISYSGPTARCERTYALAAAVSASASVVAKTALNASSCPLKACDNIFGRVVNGISQDMVCTKGLGTGVLPDGHFINIEQAIRMRRSTSSPGPTAWVAPLKAIFPAQCADGWAASPSTGMCAPLSSTTQAPAGTTSPPAPTAPTGFINCVAGRSTLGAVASCYRNYYAPASFYPTPQFPSTQEVLDLRGAVRSLLDNEGDCNGVQLGAAINAHMYVFPFTDSTYGLQYCLLMDTSDANGNGFFDKGFGFIAVANRRVDIHRHLVHSAPHPVSDADTEVEAMTLLSATGGHVGVVAGMRRDATAQASACQIDYNAMDGAHEVATAFHAALLEVRQWYIDHSVA